jgi:hypothetical protein
MSDRASRLSGLVPRGLLLGLLALIPTGCWRERECSEGFHPVRSIEFPETGRTCVEDGEEPPQGYERFPPGLEPPTYIDQE